MSKRATILDIENWRLDYWAQIESGVLNTEIAQKIGRHPTYLSKVANGAKDKNGKPKNPGLQLINDYYMHYPKFQRSPEHNEKDANEKAKPGYNHESEAKNEVEEARQMYMTRTNELLDHYKNSESFFKDGFKEILGVAKTMANSQHESVENQKIMVQSQEKIIDIHRDVINRLLDRDKEEDKGL